ncbi:PIG-L family deacetylase [Opitutia bacterium ISCC 51]|nr:PIG-L family deacetylase [Opitutae bacterium ISCC 51]QXD30088.1 PIG-L family deacetylase [Opitutae bacterium ISCC 52]
MEFNKTTAQTYIPDGSDLNTALSKTTHLAIGAHQDDLEIFAYNGIAACYGQRNQWFTGVTVTNGAGSSRVGVYEDYTDEEMVQVRADEQNKAAFVGDYAAQFQMDYSSSEIKDTSNDSATEDLVQILEKAGAKTVYLHNPADKHDTHIAVLAKSLAALRKLPDALKPEKVYGCEVWRDLDWMLDSDKSVLDCSQYENMAQSLVALYDSQISGGKRYDLATAGRRLANATYFVSHSSDDATALTWSMDLTPLVLDPSLSIKDYTLEFIDRFKADVGEKLDRLI